jgi:hypothetical protein
MDLRLSSGNEGNETQRATESHGEMHRKESWIRGRENMGSKKNPELALRAL